MSDGKVMQKYYPPDFDPEALKKKRDVLRAISREKRGRKRAGPRLMEMRMMFPFTLECESCRDFVMVGTKFNSKVERIRGEDYLGVAIWRFYGRCPHCRHQIVMRTDPKNTDYTLESGGVRTYDSNRDLKLAEEALEEARQQEVEGDAARALEMKSYSTAEELKSLETLDELRRLNKRFMGRPDKLTEFTLDKIKEKEDEKEGELDEPELIEFRQLQEQREDQDELSDSHSSSHTDSDNETDRPSQRPNKRPTPLNKSVIDTSASPNFFSVKVIPKLQGKPPVSAQAVGLDKDLNDLLDMYGPDSD